MTSIISDKEQIELSLTKYATISLKVHLYITISKFLCNKITVLLIVNYYQMNKCKKYLSKPHDRALEFIFNSNVIDKQQLQTKYIDYQMITSFKLSNTTETHSYATLSTLPFIL